MKHRAKATLKKAGNGYRIVASNEAKDRDGEVIQLSAWKNLNNYLSTNPVILWAHDYSKPPVGKAVGGQVSENALELDIEFAPTEFGKEVKALYDGGFMNTFSVGFIPKNWDTTPEGMKSYTDVELLEVSAVPVPANAEATLLRAAKAAGLNTSALEDSDTEDEEPEETNSPTAKRLLAKAESHEWDTDETSEQREIDALVMAAEIVQEHEMRQAMRTAAGSRVPEL